MFLCCVRLLVRIRWNCCFYNHAPALLNPLPLPFSFPSPSPSYSASTASLPFKLSASKGFSVLYLFHQFSCKHLTRSIVSSSRNTLGSVLYFVPSLGNGSSSGGGGNSTVIPPNPRLEDSLEAFHMMGDNPTILLAIFSNMHAAPASPNTSTAHPPSILNTY